MRNDKASQAAIRPRCTTGPIILPRGPADIQTKSVTIAIRLIYEVSRGPKLLTKLDINPLFPEEGPCLIFYSAFTIDKQLHSVAMARRMKATVC